MPNKPSPRIAIKPELYEAIRLRAAKEGMWPHELVSMWIREKLAAEPSRQIAIDPDSHISAKPKRPLDSEKIASRRTVPPEDSAQKGRAWHGGPTPYEDQYPEIAARVLELWAGGKRAGGLSRDAVAKAMQAEGVSISAAQVDKITIRARKKNI